MDAIIGRYKMRMEKDQLIISHSAGISFSLTLDEAMGLFNFINVYRETLTTTQADTEPRINSIHLEKPNNHSEPPNLL